MGYLIFFVVGVTLFIKAFNGMDKAFDKWEAKHGSIWE